MQLAHVVNTLGYQAIQLKVSTTNQQSIGDETSHRKILFERPSRIHSVTCEMKSSRRLVSFRVFINSFRGSNRLPKEDSESRLYFFKSFLSHMNAQSYGFCLDWSARAPNQVLDVYKSSCATFYRYAALLKLGTVHMKLVISKHKRTRY